MDLIVLLLSFLVIINSNTTTTAQGMDAIDLKQDLEIKAHNKQINEILFESCASEIDRNRTSIAILKFNRLEGHPIKKVVKFYIANFADNFDNLLHFIDHLSPSNLQRTAYDTLSDELESGSIDIMSVFSFHNFFRKKLSKKLVSEEKKMYEKHFKKTDELIKKMIAGTDLNEILKHTASSTNKEVIVESIPTIIQAINLNNFTDMNRIFDVSVKLPNLNQLKIIRMFLNEMRKRSQYKHVFHVVCQLKLLRQSINNGGWMLSEINLLSDIINEIPYQARRILSNGNYWQIKSLATDKCLLCLASRKYNKNILFLDTISYNWWIQCQSYKSIIIRDYYNEYLSVEYSFHNESFPTMRKCDEDDPTQSNWYFLMSDDLTYFQLKNIHTNELLTLDDVWETGHDGLRRRRVSLSSKSTNSDCSKWILKLKSEKVPNLFANGYYGIQYNRNY